MTSLDFDSPESDPKIVGLQKILSQVDNKREKELGLSVGDVVSKLSPLWKVESDSAYDMIKQIQSPYYWARQNRCGGTIKRNSTLTNGQDASRRMSDYLKYVGYSEDEAKGVFSSLKEVCQYAIYVAPNPKIKPFVRKK